MIDAWFTPESARMFAFLSLLAVTAALEPLARQGRARAAVLAVYNACAGLGVLLLGAGLMASISGQPDYVIRTLLGSGLIVAIPFAVAAFEARRIYHEAELRKTIAADL